MEPTLWLLEDDILFEMWFSGEPCVSFAGELPDDIIRGIEYPPSINLIKSYVHLFSTNIACITLARIRGLPRCTRSLFGFDHPGWMTWKIQQKYARQLGNLPKVSRVTTFTMDLWGNFGPPQIAESIGASDWGPSILNETSGKSSCQVSGWTLSIFEITT